MGIPNSLSFSCLILVITTFSLSLHPTKINDENKIGEPIDDEDEEDLDINDNSTDENKDLNESETEEEDENEEEPNDNNLEIDLTNELRPSAMGVSVLVKVPNKLIISINDIIAMTRRER